MPSPKTPIEGTVTTVSDTQRRFCVAVRNRPGLGQVWFQMSPRRPKATLPQAGQIVNFDAYGPQQDIVYEVKFAAETADRPIPETPETPPMGYSGLRTSRATVKEPPMQEPSNGEAKLPGHWTKLQLMGQQVTVDGYFVLVGEYAVLNRKNGDLYPLTSIRLLMGAQP